METASARKPQSDTSSQDDKSKNKTSTFRVKRSIFGSVSEKANRFERAGADVLAAKEKEKERPKLKLKDVFGDSKYKDDGVYHAGDKWDHNKEQKESRTVTSASMTSVTTSPLATSSAPSTSRPARMSNPEDDSKFGLDVVMTSSAHEASDVDVEAISDFVQSSCTYPYHLFSRRKKPLPRK